VRSDLSIISEDISLTPSSKSDFDAALATKDRYVFIYFHEGDIPEAASE
jgi:hypothetical protein